MRARAAWIAALSLMVAAVAATPALASGLVRLPTVTTFSTGTFPEGLAIDASGDAYVSVTTWGPTENDPGTGRLVRVSPTGTQTPVGPAFDVGLGLLTGVAADGRGGVFLAAASYQAPTPPGVWRIDRAGHAREVMTLGEDSFPNGLAVRGSVLYLSDSALGAIWRQDAGGPAQLWAQSPLLAPDSAFGANGIALWGDALYVAVTDAGRIVRIPIGHDGSAGTPQVVAQRPALKGADGIAFDLAGRLYVTTSATDRLVRLSPDGELATLATRRDGLLYPTTPAFGGPATRLFVVNGDFDGLGTPSLVWTPVEVPGAPLPG